MQVYDFIKNLLQSIFTFINIDHAQELLAATQHHAGAAWLYL